MLFSVFLFTARYHLIYFLLTVGIGNQFCVVCCQNTFPAEILRQECRTSSEYFGNHQGINQQSVSTIVLYKRPEDGCWLLMCNQTGLAVAPECPA